MKEVAPRSTPRVLFGLLLLVAVAGTSSAAAPKSAAPVVPCCLPAGDYDQDGVQDRLDACNNTPRGCVVAQHGCLVDADGDGVCDGLDQCPDTPKGEKVNSGENLEPKFPAPVTPGTR